MNLQNLSDFLDYKVFPRLRFGELLPHLAPENQGNVVRFTCPSCSMRTAITEKGSRNIRCPREVGCGFRASIIEILAYPEKPTGQTYKRIIQKLCENVGEKNFLDTSKKKKVLKRPTPNVFFESLDEFKNRGGVIKVGST